MSVQIDKVTEKFNPSYVDIQAEVCLKGAQFLFWLSDIWSSEKDWSVLPSMQILYQNM